MSDHRFDDAISEFIKLHDESGAGILTGYVLYAEYLDGDGDFSWFMAQAEGQSISTSIGQVEILRTHLRQSVEGMLHDGDE